MKNYNELLKSCDIKPTSYLKKGKSLIINNKYVIKERVNNPDIYDYLKTRSFNYFPEILTSNNYYEITKYFNEIKIPDEQKFEELIKTLAVLHSKTTYYETKNLAYNKEIYEDIKNNIEYLKSYYSDIIALIETKEFMSPSEYLFARNYTIIINSLNYITESLEKWYQKVQDMASIRIVVLHNNLELDHFIYNQSKVLISWRKAKFGSPVFDLVSLFRKYGNKYNFQDKLNIYKSICPLENEEIELLNIFMMLPPRFEFKGSEFDLCNILADKISLLYYANNIVLPNQLEDSKKNNQDEN